MDSKPRSYRFAQKSEKRWAWFLGAGGGLGLGGRYFKQTATLVDLPTISATTSGTNFLFNINFGLRNIFAKNHAIDLIIKYNQHFGQEIGNSGLSFGTSFFIAYTFLKF